MTDVSIRRRLRRHAERKTHRGATQGAVGTTARLGHSSVHTNIYKLNNYARIQDIEGHAKYRPRQVNSVLIWFCHPGNVFIASGLLFEAHFHLLETDMSLKCILVNNIQDIP